MRIESVKTCKESEIVPSTYNITYLLHVNIIAIVTISCYTPLQLYYPNVTYEKTKLF